MNTVESLLKDISEIRAFPSNVSWNTTSTEYKHTTSTLMSELYSYTQAVRMLCEEQSRIL